MESQIELSQREGPAETLPTDQSNRDEVSEPEFSLPQADGGKQAWLFLAACFMTEALIWGLVFSFGIFEEVYARTEPFSQDAAGVAAVGTSASGLMYMSPMILMPFYSYWPSLRRASAFVGLPIMAIGVLAASFANSVGQLILTQGICYGIGGAMLYFPAFLFVDEWFIRRKGFAFGVMWAGTGASGMALPFILSWSLETYGPRTTLRMWSVVLIVVLGPFLYFVKPRVPVSRTARQARPLDLRFLLSPAFWIFMFGCTMQSLGFFLPSIFLPTIAQAYGTTSTESALTLIAQNMAAVVGSLLIGALVDRFHVTSVMSVLSFVAALAVFLVWGFSQSLPLLIIFAVLYGISAGSFSTSWSGISKDMQSRLAGTDTGLVLGVLSVGRGIGAIASGPLSAVLVRASPLHNSLSGYGSDYNNLIIFTGVTAALGSTAFFARRLGWM